jgi:hypothetical protein
MYATMAFFHQGSDLLSDLEPSLRELMMALDEERTHYLTETLKQDVRAPFLSGGPVSALTRRCHRWASRRHWHRPSRSRAISSSGFGAGAEACAGNGSRPPSVLVAVVLLVRDQLYTSPFRRWFVVVEGGFHTYRSWKELNPISTHDMLLSTVKAVRYSLSLSLSLCVWCVCACEIKFRRTMLTCALVLRSENEPPHKNFVFTLVWPNKETLQLQAASEKDRRCGSAHYLCCRALLDIRALTQSSPSPCSEWIEVLLNASGYRFKQSQIANTPQHANSLTTCKTHVSARYCTRRSTLTSHCFACAHVPLHNSPTAVRAATSHIRSELLLCRL